MRVSKLSERIANEIHKRILDGDFAPNAHLRAEQLSEAFGVSRSPIRQALQLLESRNVLEQRLNHGFFVREDMASHPGRAELFIPEVHYRLADDWLHDRIPQEVTEPFLRDRYSLTKAQVISILSRAASEGWAERKEGRGWRFLVLAKTTETLEQIYRFRAMVEPAALLEPTFTLDRPALVEQRRVLEAILQSKAERSSPDRLLTNGINFHTAVARMSNNSFVYQAVVRANQMRSLLNYRTLVEPGHFCDRAREHLDMLDLLERGENLECAALLKRHLSNALMQRKSWQIAAPQEKKDALADPAWRKREPV